MAPVAGSSFRGSPGKALGSKQAGLIVSGHDDRRRNPNLPEEVGYGHHRIPKQRRSCHNRDVSDEGGFRARAGALTILLMLSVADRETTLAILAEIATGVRMEGLELPDPDDELHMAIFEDDYMLEPDEPIGPHTKFRATEAGGELLFVAGVLTSWLRQRPAGPMDFDEEAVQPVLALLGGWASGITHAFAAGPLSVGEAEERVQTLSLDAVELRIGAMEAQGLLEALEGDEGEVR